MKTTQQAVNMLEVTADLLSRSRHEFRYKTNPHVEGDNIAEHQALVVRLGAYLIPSLVSEFHNNSKKPDFERDLFPTLLFHDDEELTGEGDIATFQKQHNARDKEEVFIVESLILNLTPEQKDYELKYFKSFRERESIVAKVAKIIDNVAGNMLAIEQKIGLIQPDYAISCIDYVKKYKGISMTTDLLIDAQISQIFNIRQTLKDSKEIRRCAKLLSEMSDRSTPELITIVNELLSIDLNEYHPDELRPYIPIWKMF